MATKQTSIKLPINVESWRGTRDRSHNFTAEYRPDEYSTHRISASSHESAADAVSRLETQVVDALKAQDPILVYFADVVAIAYHHSSYGWCYQISNNQSPKDQARSMCIHGSESRESVERYMRRHLAGSFIGGFAGAEVLTHPDDVRDYFGSQAWDAGTRTVTRNFKSMDDVPQGEQERARKAGESWRERYQNKVRLGMEPAAAYEELLDEIEAESPSVVPA